jgi:5-methylcytosine-specific restriction endonuclease McrA
VAMTDPRRPIVCRGCGETFARMPEQPKRQYCTWDCFKRSRHVTLTCTVCSRAFDSYASEARKRTERGHVVCCSRACRNVHTSKLLGGAGTWVPGGRHAPSRRPSGIWRKARTEYLRGVGGMCEGCGERAIEVHHLHPVAAGGDLTSFDNLMAVCRDCHENMHTQIRAGAFWCSFEAVGA